MIKNIWTEEEKKKLKKIYNIIYNDLEPIEGKKILILCSANGDLALSLAKNNKNLHIVGLELDDTLLKKSIEQKNKKHLSNIVEFHKAEKNRIPYSDETFDVVLSEFIINPTAMETDIGQPEMARVLKKGGNILITDFIITHSSERILEELKKFDVLYICKATIDDFEKWMKEAGLINIKVKDLSKLFAKIWRKRQAQDSNSEHKNAYFLLLNDTITSLGKGIFYIYIKGTKPK